MRALLRLASVVVILGAAPLLAGCGTAGQPPPPPPDYATALRGAPAPLAEIHAEANELLPGGGDAFERRLTALRGYPVVVNIWASWCGNCVTEFPMFQQLSARFGTRVAFLGIDAEDSNEFAAAWLREAPVPYPSYIDGDQGLARSLGVTGLPATAFFDRGGDLVFLRKGAYPDEEALENEIKRYALGAV